MLEQRALFQDMHFKVLHLMQHVYSRMCWGGFDVAIGVMLCETNLCVKELRVKGLLKVQNFQYSQRKLGDFLTPASIANKSDLMYRFLACKMAEYELLNAVKWAQIQDYSLNWILFKEAGKA